MGVSVLPAVLFFFSSRPGLCAPAAPPLHTMAARPGPHQPVGLPAADPPPSPPRDSAGAATDGDTSQTEAAPAPPPPPAPTSTAAAIAAPAAPASPRRPRCLDTLFAHADAAYASCARARYDGPAAASLARAVNAAARLLTAAWDRGRWGADLPAGPVAAIMTAAAEAAPLLDSLWQPGWLVDVVAGGEGGGGGGGGDGGGDRAAAGPPPPSRVRPRNEPSPDDDGGGVPSPPPSPPRAPRAPPPHVSPAVLNARARQQVKHRLEAALDELRVLVADFPPTPVGDAEAGPGGAGGGGAPLSAATCLPHSPVPPPSGWQSWWRMRAAWPLWWTQTGVRPP